MAKELILNKHKKTSMEVICHSVSYTSQSIKYKLKKKFKNLKGNRRKLIPTKRRIH